jgi:hypothetical protein
MCLAVGVFQKGLVWFDAPVEFLFFAAGAIPALATRGKPLSGMNGMIRGSLLITGLFSLFLTAHFGYVGTDFVPGVTRTHLYIKYAGGCWLRLDFLGHAGHVEYPPRVNLFGQDFIRLVRVSLWNANFSGVAYVATQTGVSCCCEYVPRR